MAAKDWIDITERTLASVDGLTDEQMAVMRRSLDESFNQISRDMLGTYRRLEGADPRYIQVELAKLKKANIARQILSPDKADQFEAIMQTILEEQTANGVKYADLMTAALTNPPELVQQFGNINIEAVAAIAKDGRKRLQNHSEDAATKIIDAVANNLLQGGSMAKLTSTISGQLGLVKHRAENIARTSTMTAFNQASKKRYEGYGVKYVQIIALVDRRTTPWCRWRHMRIVEITAAMPPFHFMCRSTTAPVDPAWLSEDDLKWMQDEMAAAKKTGLVNMNRAPFDEKKPTFYTPSKFKNNIVPFKPEKVAIAKPADKPVEKEAAIAAQKKLQDTILDFSVASEVKNLATQKATIAPFAVADYEMSDFVDYKRAQVIVSANENGKAIKPDKRSVGQAIDMGLTPNDSVLSKVKLTKKQAQQLEINREKLKSSRETIKKAEQILSKKSVPNISKWKPTMSREEAAAYFGSDNYFGSQSFWHGNRKAVTESMKTEGAIPERNTRGVYGKGVYAGSSKGIGLTYGSPYTGDTELLEMQIYSKNPYIVDSDAMKNLTEDGMGSNGFDNDLRVLLKSKGYDSIYIKDVGYVVALDKEQVVIVDSAEPSKNGVTAAEYRDFEGAKISKFQRDMEQVKSSKEDFGTEFIDSLEYQDDDLFD